MEPLTREAILASFPPRQRKRVELYDLDRVGWDCLDFLGWTHSSGHLAYVVYQKDHMVRGVVLDKTRPSGALKSKMCSWCMSIHSGGGVTLFSAEKAADKNRIRGEYVCTNLQCSAYVRGSAKPDGCQMNENIDREARIARLRDNVERFFRAIHGEGVFSNKLES